jgi:flagellar basal body-associated protein FliL
MTKTKRRLTKAQASDRFNLILAVIALVVAILGLAIAFAVVTRNLVINGTAEIQGPDWDVRFTTQSSSATGGAQITSAKIDDRTISYHVVFTGPNQTADINFEMANNSTVDAKIANLTAVGQSDYAAKHIDYSLKYTDNTNVTAGDVLAAGASRTALIHLAYTASQAEFLADAGSQVSMTVTIQYAQAP